MNPLFTASGLFDLVDQKGSLEERQIVKRWKPDIDKFLAPFLNGIRRGEQSLEIGLENRLTLKLVVKRHKYPPVLGLGLLADSLPEPMASVARLTVDRQLDHHFGIRVDATRCHRELYVYDPDRLVAQLLATRFDLACPPPPGLTVTAFGIDERAGLSAYFTDVRNPAVANLKGQVLGMLQKELRIDLEGCFSGTWEHQRWAEGRWTPVKVGIELQNVPVEVATRVISHYRPPHFRYLVPFRAYRSLVIASSVTSDSRGWYFTY